jgi:hypothetical protein
MFFIMGLTGAQVCSFMVLYSPKTDTTVAKHPCTFLRCTA